jgi:hypothetical protein
VFHVDILLRETPRIEVHGVEICGICLELMVVRVKQGRICFDTRHLFWSLLYLPTCQSLGKVFRSESLISSRLNIRPHVIFAPVDKASRSVGSWHWAVQIIFRWCVQLPVRTSLIIKACCPVIAVTRLHIGRPTPYARRGLIDRRDLIVRSLSSIHTGC